MKDGDFYRRKIILLKNRMPQIPCELYSYLRKILDGFFELASNYLINWL